MASIHRSKITIPAYSGGSTPASQSKGRHPPAETQRLPAALFITTDPRPVSGNVKDTQTHTGPFSGCIKKHAVSPVQENKSLLNRQLEFLPSPHPRMLSLVLPCPSYSHTNTPLQIWPPLHPLNWTLSGLFMLIVSTVEARQESQQDTGHPVYTRINRKMNGYTPDSKSEGFDKSNNQTFIG